MPFVKLKRAHKYSVSTKNALLIVVELLDQKLIECSVGVESLAQECLDIVLSRLQINEETFYFGLQHLNKQHRYRWLELDKSLRKQLARATNTLGDYRLRFGVMFFTPDVNCLHYRQTRLMFFLHFKRMVTEGAIKCSLDTACKLASYALQVEYGDFNPMAHNMKFLQYYPVFPTKYYGNAPDELFEKVLKLYQERRGMSSEEAEMMYLNEVQQIEDYSVEYIRAKLEKTKAEVLIGTSPVGVTLCSELGDVAAAVAPLHRQTASGCSETSEMSVNNGSKELISWSRIHRMLYKDSAFLVIKMDKSELKVVLESGIESRYFWVRSIGNHLIFRQNKMIGDGFTGPLNNSSSLSNSAMDCGKSAYITGANEQHFDERKLLRGDASTRGRNSAYKWDKTDSFRDAASEHESGSAAGSTCNTESPFSIRYAYPSIFRRNATIQKRGTASAARHETSIDSSFNDSGNTYAQLVFNSSTLKGTKAVGLHGETLTRKSAAFNTTDGETNVPNNPDLKNSNGATERKSATIPSYDSFMSRRVSQHQRLLLESGGQHVSSHPNLSLAHSQEFQRRNSSRRLANVVNSKYGRPVAAKSAAGSGNNMRGPVAPTGDNKHSHNTSSIGPINIDSNRYNYFDNLATIGKEDDIADHRGGIHEDAYINGRPSQCLCGAATPYDMFSPVSAMLANRHMSFSGANNGKQEEHAASSSPYTSPLNHAISSPELNCFHATYQKEMQLESSYPRLQCHQHCQVHNDPHGHPEACSFQHLPTQAHLSGKIFQPAYMLYHHETPPQKMFTSTPELYHARSVSDLEPQNHQYVQRMHSNAAAARNGGSTMSHYALRKRSDPLPPTPGSIFRRNILQAGPALYDDSSHIYDLHQSVTNSSASIATTLMNPAASSHSLNNAGKHSLLGVNFSSRLVDSETERESGEAMGGHVNNISTWSISPLARFKSTDQLDKLSDCDNDTSHPYCDPEIAERRRNNPTAYQGDMRRSFIERKILDGVLQDEYSGVIIQKTSAKFTIAKMSENFSRNRFSAYLPYDDTIVKLTPSRELNPVGYINASWIKTKIAGITYRYIATQNPMDTTCMEFWQMIWEKQVTVIVMFANEGNSSSLSSNGDEHLEYSRLSSRNSYCAKYKPGRVGETVEFGHISIVAETIQHTEYCIATTLKLRNRKEMRSTVLWHLQFTHLPLLLPSKSAFGNISQDVSEALQSDMIRSPHAISSFIQFLNEIRSIRLLTREEGIDSLPIVVHCATGNGASGALILAEIMMTLIEHQEAIDVARVLTFLRYQRPHMVDSYQYYEFVHRVIIQSLALVRLI